MKTKLVRAVLLPVDKSFLYLHGGKLYNNRTTMHIPDGKQQPQQLILISLEDEKIEVGDRVIYDFFDGHKADVIVDNTIDTHPERWLGFKRVIACQSQISPELIQQLVDEYNNGDMEGLEIYMEEITDEETIASASGFSLKVPINIKYKPKLTNNFVTVVKKEPISYTEDEVRSFVFKAYNLRTFDGVVRSTNSLIDWFNQNKKK